MFKNGTLSGQWKGSFTYGKDYGDLYGESVEFMMFLQEQNGVISGKCFEMGGVGVSSEADLALIDGFFEKNHISFIKKYNHNTFFDEEGNVNNDFFKPSQEIIYEGEFDSPTNSFAGNWEIVTKTELENNDIIEFINTGVWNMKKEVD